VIDDEIAFDEKALQDIVDILRKRWSLHKQLYQHKTTQAFECLLIEVLVEYFTVTGVEKLNKIQYYIQLDDSILSEIRRSTNANLEKARKLLSDIDTRMQPRLVWHCWAMPSLEALKAKFQTEEKLELEIVNYCVNGLKNRGKSSMRFEKADIFVRWGSWSLGAVPGCKDKHPLSDISLFASGSPRKVKKLSNPQENFSLVGLGSKSVEYWIRVYVRYPHQQNAIRPIIMEFFKDWLKVLGGTPQARLSPPKIAQRNPITFEGAGKR